ncbi:MAG: ATP-binding cassette domain-containing protein [Candidatus Hydrothermae bacterium]|nr:ATP-binding cassette domain-containing protein [Candidatus Hydrothermae bacterium]
MTDPLVVEHLSVVLDGSPVLEDVSFSLQTGTLTTLLGPSGVGKTTLLRALLNLIPYRGRVHHAPLAYMPQRPTLLSWRTLWGNVVLLEEARGQPVDPDRVRALLRLLDLEGLENRYPSTLSGGEARRVALARTLLTGGEVFLLDEPMAGMNLEEKEDMARYIIDLNEEWGMTVVMIEHDMGVVMDISHRVMVLDFGRKIAGGLPDEVMANPQVRKAYLGEDDEPAPEPQPEGEVA